MNNALTFALNLETAGFQTPAKTSIQQIDSIGAAASNANRQLIQLNSGLLVKNNAAGMAAAAASQLRAGTYLATAETQGLANTVVRLSGATTETASTSVDAMRALKGMNLALKELGFLIAPQMTFALTSTYRAAKVAKLEMAALGVGMAPLSLGLIGVVAGLATFTEWIKKLKAEAEVKKSTDSLAVQNEDRKARLTQIVTEGVGSGKISDRLARRLHWLLQGVDPDSGGAPLPTPPGIGGMGKAFFGTHPANLDPGKMSEYLNKAAMLLLSNGIGPGATLMDASLKDFQAKLAAESETDPVKKQLMLNAIREKQLYLEASAIFTGPDVDPLRKANLSIAMWRQAADAHVQSLSGGLMSAGELKISELQRMGAVFNSDAQNNDMRRVADSSDRQEKLLKQILDKITAQTTANQN